MGKQIVGPVRRLVIVSYRDHEGEHLRSRRPDRTQGRVKRMTLHKDDNNALLRVMASDNKQFQEAGLRAWHMFEQAPMPGNYGPKDDSHMPTLFVRDWWMRTQDEDAEGKPYQILLYLKTITNRDLQMREVQDSILPQVFQFAEQEGVVSGRAFDEHQKRMMVQ